MKDVTANPPLGLLRLEGAILDSLTRSHPHFRAQFDRLRDGSLVRLRELSGAGFFTHYSDECAVTFPGQNEMIANADCISGPGLLGGFHLAITDEQPDVLEGFCLDGLWPQEWDSLAVVPLDSARRP
ncbi:MAG: hypothetical protein AB7J28_09095 [Hyphomonadaceae bacterium]